MKQRPFPCPDCLAGKHKGCKVCGGSGYRWGYSILDYIREIWRIR